MPGGLVVALVGVVVVAAIAAVVAFVIFRGGGEEEGAIVAVAFRLEAGSPLMAAYIGDPSKDPFQLSAGRYYVEALDENDVLVSLGAVEMEEEDAVEFPESFEAAGGAADAEQVEPLLTVASFLIDVELAELTLLEVVTGGFTELPFDPAVELGATDFSEVLQMYGDIGEEGDAILEAISDIEGRAQVSLGIRYVRSAGAPGPGAFDKVKQEAQEFIDLALGVRDHQRQRIVELVQSLEKIPAEQETGRVIFEDMPSDLKGRGDSRADNLDEWLSLLRRGELDDRLPQIDRYLDDAARGAALVWTPELRDEERLYDFIARLGAFNAEVIEHRKDPRLREAVSQLGDKEGAWRAYARNILEGSGEPGLAQEELRLAIRSNVDRLFPHSPTVAERVTEYFIKRVIKHAPELAGLAPTRTAKATATPPPAPEATPTPDTSWIEGFVANVGGRMMEEGYPDELTSGVMAVLYDCLMEAVLGGKSMEEAVGECARQFDQGAATPSGEETEQPADEGEEVTAVGRFLAVPVGPNQRVEENRMSLTFSSGGGAVTGEAVIKALSLGETCPPAASSQTTYLEGTYYPDKKKFEGTWRDEMTVGYYVGTCDNLETATVSREGRWEATLEGAVVRGKIPIPDPNNTVLEFELTVQE